MIGRECSPRTHVNPRSSTTISNLPKGCSRLYRCAHKVQATIGLTFFGGLVPRGALGARWEKTKAREAPRVKPFKNVTVG